MVLNCGFPKVSRGPKGTPKGKLSHSNLESHLKKHTEEYKLYIKEKNDLKEAKKQKLDENLNVENEMESSDCTITACRTQESRQNVLISQQTLDGFVLGEFKAQPVGSTYTLNDARDKTRTRNLIKMIIIDLQPFSMVSDAGFLNYSFVMDPHYKVKSETYYKNIFDKCYTNGMEKVKKKLINDKPSVISVQLDRWSGNHNSHVGVIINYITDGFKRVSLPICCEKFNESHSANNLSIWLDEKLEDWEIRDKVKVIVSDSAANMQAMVDQMYDVQHVKCLNHVLNLIVKDEILEKPQIRKLIETVRKVSNFPNSSALFAEAVRSKCIERNCAVQALVPDVVTRWNSTLDMLVRFIELEDVIKDVLFVDGWNERVMDSSSISSADWKLMKNVISVLKPFKSATLKLSSVSACVSEYIPTVTCLVKSLETQTQNDEGVVSLKRRLAENLRSRTGHMMKI